MPVPKIVQQWVDLRAEFERRLQSGRDPRMARILPIAKISRTWYFVDERLRQLRNVTDPADFLDFESDGDLLIYVMQNGRMIA